LIGVTRAPINTPSTAIFGMPPTEEMDAILLENDKKANRWAEIRLLSDEDAKAQLTEEELETFTTYHREINEDIEKMRKIAEMMSKDVEIIKNKPKTKGQRKRDAFARKQERAAANARAMKN